MDYREARLEFLRELRDRLAPSSVLRTVQPKDHYIAGRDFVPGAHVAARLQRYDGDWIVVPEAVIVIGGPAMVSGDPARVGATVAATPIAREERVVYEPKTSRHNLIKAGRPIDLQRRELWGMALASLAAAVTVLEQDIAPLVTAAISGGEATTEAGDMVASNSPTREELAAALRRAYPDVEFTVPGSESFVQASLGPGPRAVKVFPSSARRRPRIELWLREPYARAWQQQYPTAPEFTGIDYVPPAGWVSGNVDHTLPFEAPEHVGPQSEVDWVVRTFGPIFEWASTGAVPEGRRGSRYEPLAEWLAAQGTDEVDMSFDDIEALVGDLPAYAREHAAFWYGSAAGSPTHVQKRVWESAGYTVKTVSLPDEQVMFHRLSAHEDITATLPRYWWVNQGQTYDREMAGGYVWAPVRAKNGQELTHHKNVTELRVGDYVLHYQRGIKAVGRVAAPPEFAPKPDEITEDAWENDGRLARIDYTVLDEPIPLERIPVTWRIEEGGPFNSTGAVNQAYMFSLSVDFVRRLAGRFPEIEAALGVEPAEDTTTEATVTELDEIARSVRGEGLRIDDRTLRRFHLAIQTRGFVILSGISGTGKTWLAEAYARAVHGELLLVPVAPNWNTNEDLLGYLNPIDGEYHDTAFSRFVRAAGAEWLEAQAEQRPARPFFLVLDEMNLARVEYYFAQFLSALEVRARSGTGMLHLGHDEVPLGGNLRFVGTVNIDETTHGFADKVYDRAQLIELAAPRAALEEHIGDVAHADALLEVWDALHGVAPFAFRVVDEIDVYVREAGELGVPWVDALDEQLLQKVLPKIRGLDPSAGEALEAFVALADGRFPLSGTKAAEMLARFNQHGSVSFFGDAVLHLRRRPAGAAARVGGGGARP